MKNTTVLKSSSMPHLTEEFVRKVMPPEGKDHVVIFDSATPNFALRVTRAGAKSYVSQRRIGAGRGNGAVHVGYRRPPAFARGAANRARRRARAARGEPVAMIRAAIVAMRS